MANIHQLSRARLTSFTGSGTGVKGVSNAPPVWTALPALVVIPANASAGLVVLDLTSYVSDSDTPGFSVTLNGTLPSGLYLDTDKKVKVSSTPARGTSSPVNFVASDGFSSIYSSLTSFSVPNNAPVWGNISTINATVGIPLNTSLTGSVSDPDGDPLTFGRDGSVADTGPPAITVSSSGLLTVPTSVAVGTHQISVYADDGVSDYAVDWAARSQAPGVIWAHDFSSSAEVDQFRFGNNPQADGYQYNRVQVGPGPLQAQGDGNCRWIAADAQTGRPCLELNIPTKPAAITVTSISNAATAVFTSASAHGLTVGKGFYFKSLAGGSWANLNETSGGAGGVLNPTFVVLSVPTSTTFTCRGGYGNGGSAFPGVAVDGTAMGTYTASSGNLNLNNSTDAGWLRPFSPLTAGTNGKATDDYAAGGTIPRRTTWNPNNLNCAYDWRDGYFAHADYAATCNSWPGSPAGTKYLGGDFWIQFRVKFSPGRFDPANTAARFYGKLLFIGTTADTPTHEIVVRSSNFLVDDPTQGAIFQMYTGAGADYRLVEPYRGPSNGQGKLQPGGAYDPPPTGVCYLTGTSGLPQNCWMWPSDEWVTVLMHIIPGHSGRSAVDGDTGVQVWVARAGVTSYTKIHDKLNYWFSYGDSYHPPTAWNAFLPSAFMNSLPAPVGFTHRFTEIILKKGNGGTNPEVDGIPCPQV